MSDVQVIFSFTWLIAILIFRHVQVLYLDYTVSLMQLPPNEDLAAKAVHCTGHKEGFAV